MPDHDDAPEALERLARIEAAFRREAELEGELAELDQRRHKLAKELRTARRELKTALAGEFKPMPLFERPEVPEGQPAGTVGHDVGALKFRAGEPAIEATPATS